MNNETQYSNKGNNNRTIRMIIVDDEAIICEGLQKTIEWSEIGVAVTGIAYGGEQALEICQADPPDIVLSDIRMEGMDGLALSERLKSEYNSIHIIMLSGYDDFEYARSAMRIGVTDYLLKPVDVDELKKVVKQLVVRIHQLEEAGSRIVEAQWFMEAIQGTMNTIDDSIRSRYDRPYGNFRIIACQLAHYSRHFRHKSSVELGELQVRWKSTMMENLQAPHSDLLVASDHPNSLYVFVYASDEDRGDAHWEDQLTQITRNWSEGDGMYCAISSPYNELDCAELACEQARQLLQYHVLGEKNVLTKQLCIELDRIRQATPFAPDVDWVLRLSAWLFRQEWSEVEVMVRKLFADMQEHHMLLPETTSIYEEQMALLRQRLRQNGLLIEQMTEQSLSIDLNLYNSYDAIEDLALTELRTLYDDVGTYATNKSYWIVEKAMKYIADNYFQEIKAYDVANWLNITPSHFSYIFKQNTGENFKEYINKVRIGHAQRLLESTNDKVFEIADQVGYKEYKYFVSVFKSITGITPKEFRAMKVRI